MRHGGQKELGLGIQTSDHLLNLVSGLILGPSVDGTGGVSLVGVPHTWNVSPKLCLNQLTEGWRHLKVVGRENSHGLFEVGARLDGGPQSQEQI